MIGYVVQGHIWPLKVNMLQRTDMFFILTQIKTLQPVQESDFLCFTGIFIVSSVKRCTQENP